MSRTVCELTTHGCNSTVSLLGCEMLQYARVPFVYGVYACICVDDNDDDDEGIVIVDRVLVTTFCTIIIAPSELEDEEDDEGTVLLSMIMAGVAK